LSGPMLPQRGWPLQSGRREVGALQLRLVEDGSLHLRYGEGGLLQLGAGEVGPPQVGIAEEGPWSCAWLRLAPSRWKEPASRSFHVPKSPGSTARRRAAYSSRSPLAPARTYAARKITSAPVSATSLHLLSFRSR